MLGIMFDLCRGQGYEVYMLFRCYEGKWSSFI